MQRTADVHDQIPGTCLPQAIRIEDHATALDAAVDGLDADAMACDAPIRGFLGARAGPAPRLLGGHDDRDLVERERQTAAVLEQPAACGSGGGRGIRHPLVLDTARRGSTQTEHRERRVAQQHMFHRMACFLTAITARLLKRVLGAREAPCGAIVANRGEVSARTGAAAGNSAGFSALPSARPGLRLRPRSPRGAAPALAKSGWGHPPACAVSPAGPLTGRESIGSPGFGPSRTTGPVQPGAGRS